MSNKIKLSMAWSGGKDSALALFKILNDPNFEVCNLHTVIIEETGRVGMHGVQLALIEAQSKAMGIPLEVLYMKSSQDHDLYNQVIHEFCTKQKQSGITHIGYGDIFLEDLKQYREKQLEAVGLKGVFPLWQIKTTEVLNTFLNTGFQTKICAANAALKQFVGLTLDWNLSKKFPGEVDPCGENGEFHTFVFQAPYFSESIPIKLLETSKKEYQFYVKNKDGGTTEQTSTFYFKELSLL